ncbi:MAG TPA: tetratricopeptide repeat protein [Proteobacteria bacterium]|nr:tetratricopeptide repeat protein [Pseudomonadota bacterium]
MPKTTFKQKISLITFGLFLGIILLEAGLRIGGFVLLHLQERANMASLKEKGEFIILCLGESTTALGGNNSYPRQLERILNDRDIGIRFSVINKGIAATNTTMIANLLEENLDHYRPDMVLTMVGINDSNALWAFEDISHAPFQRFIRNLRVYKLARLLYKHIVLTLGDSEQPISPDDKGDIINDPPKSEIADATTDRRLALEKKIRSDVDDPQPYLELGDIFMRKGDLAEAEKCFRKIELLDPGLLEGRYDKLTQLYYDQGLNNECLRLGEKVISSHPGKINSVTGTQMARAYLNLSNPKKAEWVCRLVLERDPGSAPAWCYLGDAHRARGRWDEAEEAYRRAVDLKPGNIAFTHLMREYFRRRQFKKAEELGKALLVKQPDNPRLLGTMAHCYQIWGKQALADYYYNESVIRQCREYRAETIENYRRIKRILDERGIQLVCVQYPMRSIKPLEIIFSGRNVPIFVDNEIIFKGAVRRGSYRNYFTDCFGGDFGHCTRQGNHLLALNIADTILREFFNVDQN